MLKIAWAPIYAHSLPVGHRFPMIKYELLPEQLLYEGTIQSQNLFEPKPMSEEIILQVHDIAYWQKLIDLNLSRKEERKTGFPLSKGLVEREITILDGTLQASIYALKYGVGINVAGGTHHAYRDRGEGFCLLNDVAVSAQYLLDHYLAKQILVVDLDVHQGNGTAKIFENESRVFTFSMHGAKNYPMHKEKSDLDVELADGTGDTEYLKKLNFHLDKIVEAVNPDFVFFVSGVDILATDKLGRLGVSLEGCKGRDRMVIEMCKSLKLPLVISMGGGYSEKIQHIVEAHANTFRLTQEIYF
ncbi:histone deacetylase family protein [Peijinzhouia sedimentorum]